MTNIKISLEDLRPSSFSSEGFLGKDTRPLEEIVRADVSALKKLGIEKSTLVERLKSVFEAAKNAFGAEIDVSRNITAAYFESRGKIPSPFPEDGLFEKGEVVVHNHRTKESLIITKLGINLIEQHDFFQGLGSRYRMDPKLAKKMLSL